MSKKADSTIKDNQKNQRIQVFARTRPLNGSEIKQHSRNVLEVCAEKREIRVRDGKMTNKAFAFDRVFGPETSQIQVYQVVVGPLIQEVLMGYNCTVFAYGQTSTGKTFTMEGERSDKSCTWDEDPKAGIIPRSLHQLFEELYKEESVEFSVHVSFLELYNEELFDLLSPNDVHIAKLRLFEDSARKGSVVIQGLEEIKVNSKDEVYAILERGTIRRQTAATHLNASSSRSHTVFSVTVHIKENTIDGEELLKTGKLNLVDLAGSENIGRSGASQKTAREAGNINQSLLTLGRVITALVEKAPHVPYRESKLTRLLQDSLGGHTKTSIIATVSPASCNTEETISTLDYAQRAKSITIKPEVNQKMTKKALIKEYTEEIERLRKDLVAARDNNLGIFIHKDNFRSMEELKEVNDNLINKNKELFESLAETQIALEDIKIQLDDTTTKYSERTAECESLEKKLSKTLKTLKHTQQALNRTVEQRDEKQYIIGVQSETEQKLTQQANTLLEVAHESTKNLSTLHNTVERKTNVQLSNDERSQEFQTKFLNKLNTINGIISEIAKEQSSNLNAIEVDIGGVLESCQKYYSDFRNCFIEKFDEEFQRQAEIITQMFTSGIEDRVTFCDVNMEHVSGFKIENDQLTHGLRFLMERHASMKENWIAFIARLTNWFIEFRTQTKSKLQQLEEQINSSASSHKALTDDLAKLFEEFSSQQMRQSQWCDDQISSITAEELQYDKEIEEKLQAMQNALSSIQSLKKEKTQRLSDKAAMSHDAHNQNVESIKTASTHHNSKIESFNQEELAKTLESVVIVQHLCKSHEDRENELHEKCKSVLVEQTNVSEEMMVTFLSSEESVKAQKDELVRLESLTNEEKGKLKEAKDRYLEQVEIAKHIADHQISDIKLHVKLQEDNLIPHFTNQVGLVSNTRKRVLESTDSLRNECSDCSTRVKRFFEEELQKDVPSGNTPKRKCYIISDDLAQTSPHEKILELRRLQIDLDGTRTVKNSRQDSSSDNSQDSPRLKRRIMSSKDTLSIADNCSSSDESTTCYSDTYSSQPDLASDSSRNNKENLRSPSKKSKIPKKKKTPRKAVIKAQTSTRKPLTSSNVPIQE